ncbi:hypothetical protein ABTL98_18860, partial [Acinetobacter baumannii]
LPSSEVVTARAIEQLCDSYKASLVPSPGAAALGGTKLLLGEVLAARQKRLSRTAATSTHPKIWILIQFFECALAGWRPESK